MSKETFVAAGKTDAPALPCVRAQGWAKREFRFCANGAGVRH